MIVAPPVEIWPGLDDAIVDELVTYDTPDSLRELLGWVDLMESDEYRRIARLIRRALAHNF